MSKVTVSLADSSGGEYVLGVPYTVSSSTMFGVYDWNDYPWTSVGVCNWYLQPTQAVPLADLTTALKAGVDVNVTKTPKGTQYIADIVAGKAPALAWLNDYVSQVIAVGKVAKPLGRKVYATLQHEAKPAVAQGSLTGASADPATIGKAQAEFTARLKAAVKANDLAGTVVATHWLAGSDRSFEGTVLAQHVISPPDLILFDPYANSSASQTFEGVVAGDLDWLTQQPAFNGRWGLGETGKAIKFGDASVAAFIESMPAGVQAEERRTGTTCELVVWFNRARDADHAISTPPRTDGLKFPLSVAALQSVMS